MANCLKTGVFLIAMVLAATLHALPSNAEEFQPQDGSTQLPYDPNAVPYVPSENVWYSCPPRMPRFNVTGQLVWLARDMTEQGHTLVYETYGNVPAPFQTTLEQAGSEDLTFDVEAGFRGSILLGSPLGRQVELSYLGIFDQSATLELTIPPPGAAPADPNEIRLTGSGIRYFNFDLISTTLFDWSVSYNSSMHTAEVNWWLNDTWCFRPFVGVRWIDQSESFDIQATADPSVIGVSDLTNNMVGGQLGFLCVLWRRTDWFRAQAICKAGCYHNQMDLQSSIFATGATLATMQNSAESRAYSGEVDVSALWQLGPHLNFHVGYTGLWLGQVASIGDQFNDLNIGTGTGQLDLRGISYQGGHLGFTVTW